jgi:hypothetical protein
MDKLLRLEKAISLELPDRPPILGGWLAAPEHIQAMTGCSESDYWSNPFYWGAEAEKVLGSDGVIDIFVPISKGGYRILDHEYPIQQHATSVDSFLTYIDEQPGAEELIATFDPETSFNSLKESVQKAKSVIGDMAWVIADWKIVPNVIGHWSFHFGVETTMITLALHPDRFRKLIQNSAIVGRQNAEILVRAVKEGLIPPVVLSGEDLCSHQGPLVSPKFLRKEYWHLVEYTLEPLHEANVKVVWHCDGNWQKLFPDVLAVGVNGLQGFQEECGMTLDWISSHKTKNGSPLLIFGPISVTGKLLYGSPKDIYCEVQNVMEISRDKCSLVFFTSNTITPDIPINNVIALWESVNNSHW